jgi:hypothetical protein
MSARDKGSEHYIVMDIQPWDVVDTWSLEQRIGYYRGGALKYLMRMGSKDPSRKEIEKAAHYCEKLAETLRKSQDVDLSATLVAGLGKWISWPGGDMPVSKGTRVEVLHRSGHVFEDLAGSGRAEDWGHSNHPADILSYRVSGTPFPDGIWVEWFGGPQPVPDHTVVEVKFRDGVISSPQWAGLLDWEIYGPEGLFPESDIVAYKVVNA